MTTVGSGRPSAPSTGTPQEVAIPDEALTAALDRAAQRWPERAAVDFLGATTTYRELADSVARGAQVLLDLGVRPGDRVALVMPNCTGHVIAFYAALRIGAVVVEHNPTYTAGELAVARRRAEEVHGHALRPALGGPVERRGERLVGDRHLLRGAGRGGGGSA